MNSKLKSFFGILLIIFFFIAISYYVQTNLDFFRGFTDFGVWSILIYILITITAIVIAPVSSVPLIPLASNVFGWFYAGIYNLLGWTIGSFIVFWICRKYGVSLIKKLISLESIYKIESKIPKENRFASILLLRMITPVDLLSYALGLFTKVDFKTYAIATILGIAPFAFIFSYLGAVSLMYQAIGFIISGILILFIIYLYGKIKGKRI